MKWKRILISQKILREWWRNGIVVAPFFTTGFTSAKLSIIHLFKFSVVFYLGFTLNYQWVNHFTFSDLKVHYTQLQKSYKYIASIITWNRKTKLYFKIFTNLNGKKSSYQNLHFQMSTTISLNFENKYFK